MSESLPRHRGLPDVYLAPNAGAFAPYAANGPFARIRSDAVKTREVAACPECRKRYEPNGSCSGPSARTMLTP